MTQAGGVPFFANDPTWWEVVAERLPHPWPEEAVLTDLRHFENQVRRGAIKYLPSRPALARRWGVTFWTDKKVRRVLSLPDWHDPLHPLSLDQLRPPKGPTEGRPRADEGPTEGRHNTDQPTESKLEGPTEGRPRADEGPTGGHTRVLQPTTNNQQPEQDPSGGVLADLATQAAQATNDPTLDISVTLKATKRRKAPPRPIAELWEWLHASLPPEACPGRKDLSEENQKALERITRDGWDREAVALVWRWRCTSEAERAQFLRANGHRWETLARRFETYHALALNPVPGGPGPPRGPRQRPETPAERAMREFIEADEDPDPHGHPQRNPTPGSAAPSRGLPQQPVGP